MEIPRGGMCLAGLFTDGQAGTVAAAQRVLGSTGRWWWWWVWRGGWGWIPHGLLGHVNNLTFYIYLFIVCLLPCLENNLPESKDFILLRVSLTPRMGPAHSRPPTIYESQDDTIFSRTKQTFQVLIIQLWPQLAPSPPTFTQEQVLSKPNSSSRRPSRDQVLNLLQNRNKSKWKYPQTSLALRVPWGEGESVWRSTPTSPHWGPPRGLPLLPRKWLCKRQLALTLQQPGPAACLCSRGLGFFQGKDARLWCPLHGPTKLDIYSSPGLEGQREEIDWWALFSQQKTHNRPHLPRCWEGARHAWVPAPSTCTGIYLVQASGGLRKSGIQGPTPSLILRPLPHLHCSWDPPPVNLHSSVQVTTCDRTEGKRP